MRWASSFLVSIALHAVVFALPISLFFAARGEQVFPVVLLVAGGGSTQGPVVKASRGTGTTPQTRIRRSAREEAVGVRAPEGSSGIQERPGSYAEEGAEEGVMIAAAPESHALEARDVEGDGHLMADSFNQTEGEKGKGESTGTGSETGLGGQNGDPSGWVFVRPDYAYNPKPEYPERARRERWEGVVFLRVLVDQQGKSKKIEVSRSSSFAILDRAAVEAVKAWRFYPARYGEREMESWVRVPIVFRLSDHDGQTSKVNR